MPSFVMKLKNKASLINTFKKNKKMENNNSKLLWGIAIGAAAGLLAGYLLSGRKIADLSDDIKDAATNLKSTLDDTLDKGKQVVDDLKQNINNNGSQV